MAAPKVEVGPETYDPKYAGDQNYSPTNKLVKGFKIGKSERKEDKTTA